MCLITPDPGLFSFINQGALTVDGIDDVEEMQLCDVSSENGLSTPPPPPPPPPPHQIRG